MKLGNLDIQGFGRALWQDTKGGIAVGLAFSAIFVPIGAIAILSTRHPVPANEQPLDKFNRIAGVYNLSDAQKKNVLNVLLDHNLTCDHLRRDELNVCAAMKTAPRRTCRSVRRRRTCRKPLPAELRSKAGPPGTSR